MLTLFMSNNCLLHIDASHIVTLLRVYSLCSYTLRALDVLAHSCCALVIGWPSIARALAMSLHSMLEHSLLIVCTARNTMFVALTVVLLLSVLCSHTNRVVTRYHSLKHSCVLVTNTRTSCN
jgi:hypothetical protein